MKICVVFVILLHVTQHALARVVEVYTGDSVLLTCQYHGFIPEENPQVMWTRSDISPKFVHLRGKKGDLKGQNQLFSGRTSMMSDALETSDFSLTLRKPQMSDSGDYTCSISDSTHELKVTDVQLKVKDHQVEVVAYEGAESVILPCITTSALPKYTTVEWTLSEPDFMTVFVYSNTNTVQIKQSKPYKGRTEVKEDLLITGDVSLTLKYPTDSDAGSFICTIYRDKDILRQKVVLTHVKEKFPTWAKGLLVLPVLPVLVFVVAGLSFHFRHCCMSVSQVEVESGVESVLLPYRTLVHLPDDAQVQWRDRYNRMVHFYKNGSDQPDEQNQIYRNRTTIKRNLLKYGNLSLTLKHPTNEDSQTYICTVSTAERIILMKKYRYVELTVRVPQVEVESGVESVLLPCRTSFHLPDDTKVEWRDSYHRIVHVYQNGSDQPEEQNQFYRNRTKMEKNLRTHVDLSLTLKHSVDGDSNTYTCSIYSREGDILMKKQVKLTVRVPQVEVDSGVESVLLPCRTTVPLPGDTKVEWRDSDNRIVHVYQNGSDQPEEQNQFYRNRTKPMNLQVMYLHKYMGFSLTLKHPTDGDSNTYTCSIYSREGDILMKKQVKLTVRVCHIEAEEGAESVLLPFKTTTDLPEDSRVQWWCFQPEFVTVHLYQNSSDQPDEQDQFYRTRTGMKRDPLKTGDLSLTLKHPKDGDSGEYTCGVWSEENMLRLKTVWLTVKGGNVQVHDQEEDIRERSGSVDLTPLMGDQSV